MSKHLREVARRQRGEGVQRSRYYVETRGGRQISNDAWSFHDRVQQWNRKAAARRATAQRRWEKKLPTIPDDNFTMVFFVEPLNYERTNDLAVQLQLRLGVSGDRIHFRGPRPDPSEWSLLQGGPI